MDGIKKSIQTVKEIICCRHLHMMAFKFLLACYSLYGVCNTFYSIKVLKVESWEGTWRIVLFILSCYIISYFLCYLYDIFVDRRKLFNLSSEHAVYYMYGNIFDEQIIKDKKRNIVIPVNRCFDTLVDNDLISEKTLHGQCFQQLYKKCNFTEDKLHEKIECSLQRQNLSYEIAPDKQAGYNKKYQIGSIAEIETDKNTKYFLLALSSYENETMQTTKEEYCIALSRLCERICDRSQGMPVLIPLIGAGLSKTKLDEKILFQFMQDFFHANKGIIHCDIYIVLRSNLKYLIP